MLPLIASAGKGDLTRGLVLHGLYYYLPLSSLPFSSSPPLLPSSSPSWSLADAIEVPKEYTGRRNDKERGSGCRDLRVLPRWPVYVCVCVCVCVCGRARAWFARSCRKGARPTRNLPGPVLGYCVSRGWLRQQQRRQQHSSSSSSNCSFKAWHVGRLTVQLVAHTARPKLVFVPRRGVVR